MSFSDYFCCGLLVVFLLMGIGYIIIGHINDYLYLKGHGIALVLSCVTMFIFYSGLKIEDKTIDLDNIIAFLEIACPVTLIFIILVTIVWLMFNKVYPFLDKIYEKHKKDTTNNGSGWKEYYTDDVVHRFVYWNGAQDGTLYKVIYDKKSIVIKTHISIEMADNMMDCYRKTGVYKEDKQ